MPFSLRHLLVAAAGLTAAAACAFAAARAGAAAVCGEGTYAYAGFAEQSAVGGVTATIQQAGPLAVHAGHVAAWIGIVDPRTSSSWLQVGLSALPGQTSSAIYFEYAAPGHARVYRQLASGIEPGQPHTFAVLEQPWSVDTWAVWVDGRPIGAPLHLAGSSRHWTAQVLGESWAGSRSGACNAYSYAFANVKLATRNGRWIGLDGRPIADPHYVVAQRTNTSFVASSFGVGSFRGAEVAPPAPATPASNQ